MLASDAQGWVRLWDVRAGLRPQWRLQCRCVAASRDAVPAFAASAPASLVGVLKDVRSRDCVAAPRVGDECAAWALAPAFSVPRGFCAGFGDSTLRVSGDCYAVACRRCRVWTLLQLHWRCPRSCSTAASWLLPRSAVARTPAVC